MESIFGITSRLIANRVSYRMKNEPIQKLCDLLQQTWRQECNRRTDGTIIDR
jgi:hypothetical protein